LTLLLTNCTTVKHNLKPSYGFATTANPLLLIRIDEGQVPNPDWIAKSRAFFTENGCKSISYISVADTLYAHLIKAEEIDKEKLQKMGSLTNTDYFIYGYFEGQSKNAAFGFAKVDANSKFGPHESDRWASFHIKAYDLRTGEEVASISTQVRTNGISSNDEFGSENRYFLPANTMRKAFKKAHKKFYKP